MALTDNLVFYIENSEASGDAADSTGNGYTFTAHGSPGATANPFTNAGRTYNGSTNYHEINDAAGLSLGADTAFSVRVCVRPTTLSGVTFLFAKDDASSNREWTLYWDNSANRFTFSVNGLAGLQAVVANTLGAPSTNTSYHILAGYDQPNGKLWINVNGNYDEVSYTSGTVNTAAPVTLGGYGFHSFGLVGSANRASLWIGRSLTSAEQTALYNSGSPIAYASFASALAIACPVFTSATNTAATITRVNAMGGTAPYIYEWQRATAANGSYTTGLGSGTTLTDSAISAGTTYWWRVKVVDSQGSPVTVYSAPVIGRLWPAPLVWGFIGDSVWQVGGSTSPDAFVARLRNLVKQRTVAVGASGNQAVAGTKSGDWLIAGSYLGPAETAFNSAGVNAVYYQIGNNDATNGGSAPISTSTFSSNVAATVAHLLANVTGIQVVALGAPTFNALTGTGGTTDDNAQALWDYRAILDGLCNGTTIIKGDRLGLYYFATNQTELSDGEHPNATGQASLGQLAANAVADSLYDVAGSTGANRAALPSGVSAMG